MARVQVVLRKAYGGAYIVMDSKSLGAEVSLAWPSNSIAVMGADAAASIVFRKEFGQRARSRAAPEGAGRGIHERLITPYIAAGRGMVDDVIDPGDTRILLIRALDTLRCKRAMLPNRKHGNMPL